MSDAISKLTVFVVEDSPLVLRRRVALIESAGLAEVVGMCDDAISALRIIPALAPGVVLTGLHLRAGTGLDAVSGLTRTGSKAIKIALTNHASSAVREATRVAGVDHFYDKTSEFMLAISRIGNIARERVAGPRET